MKEYFIYFKKNNFIHIIDCSIKNFEQKIKNTDERFSALCGKFKDEKEAFDEYVEDLGLPSFIRECIKIIYN